jgi:hypothetical protein
MLHKKRAALLSGARFVPSSVSSKVPAGPTRHAPSRDAAPSKRESGLRLLSTPMLDDLAVLKRKRSNAITGPS